MKLRKGLTLIEIVVTTVILASVILAIGGFSQTILNISPFTEEILSSQQNVNLVLKVMTMQIRSAGPSNLGAYPIESVATNSLIFYSDYDSDGLFERTRYFLSGTILKKGIIKPSGVPLTYPTSSETVSDAANNVILGNPIFEYYGTNFTGTQSPLTYPVNISEIRVIGVTLTVDSNPSASPKPVTYNTKILIRNLRTN